MQCIPYNKLNLLYGIHCIMTENQSLGFLIADVSRLTRRSFQNKLEGTGLTLATARALLYISKNEGIRQVVLAEMLEIKPISLARLVDQLADAGVVERRPDPTDRRAHKLYLTAAAEPQLTIIKSVIKAVGVESLMGLNVEQQEAMLAALAKMRCNLSV